MTRVSTVCKTVGGREKGLQNRSFERYAIRQKADGYNHARKNEGDIATAAWNTEIVVWAERR